MSVSSPRCLKDPCQLALHDVDPIISPRAGLVPVGPRSQPDPASSGWDYSPTGINPVVASGRNNIDLNFAFKLSVNRTDSADEAKIMPSRLYTAR